MTTGSWNRDNFTTVASGGFKGLKWSRTWTGSDQTGATVKYPRPPLRTVVRNGRAISFREKRIGRSPPPKRARYDEHGYTMSETRLVDEEVQVRTGGPGSPLVPRALISSYGVTDWGPSDLLGANTTIKLLGKLKEKMNGSDFNLGVVLGEGHQVLRMIGDTAIQLASSLHRLRRGDFAGAAKRLFEGTGRQPRKPRGGFQPFKATTAEVSSRWLELQYGWLPLLKDVEAGAHFVAHRLSVPMQETYRVSARAEQNQVRITDLGFGAGNPRAEASRFHRRSIKVVVKERPSLLASLGLLDPSVVAWELVPFSFVADWFIPIGSYLEARAFHSHVVGSYVVSNKMVGQGRSPTASASCMTGNTATAVYHRVNFDRVVTSSAPLPRPEWKGLAKAASVQHVLNGIALLAQAAVRKL